MSDNLLKANAMKGRTFLTQTDREGSPRLKAGSGEQDQSTAPERPAERDVFRTLQRKLRGDTMYLNQGEPCLPHP